MQSQNKIRGLSLTRPWEFAFLHGKRIENRSWKPPLSLKGCYIALHTAKSWSEDDREFISIVLGIDVPDKNESRSSEIFAVCRWYGQVFLDSDSELIPTAVDIPQYQQKWFFGPFGWLLEDFVPLKTPVACLGSQGLWSFDNKLGVLDQLRESYKESSVTATL